MSVKIIAELNPVTTERTILYTEPKSIADIINEINSDIPISQARVCRNGEIVKDFSSRVVDGDELTVKFVPYGNNPRQTGGYMKAGGWGLMALGIAAFFIPVVGAFIGTALVGAGLGMALGGTVLMNTNIPKLADVEKPESDQSIRGGRNQARLHGRIPVLLGRHRIYPDLAANPHTEIIDGKQYFTQLFCGGYKDYVIDLISLKLGETPIVDLSQTKSITSILAGADPLIRLEIMQNGETSNIYPYCVHEDAVNAPLNKLIDGPDGQKISGEVIRTTPDNTDAINVDIFFHNGIGKYNDSGGITNASVEVKVSFKIADENESAYQLLGFFNSENGDNTIFGAELKTKRCQITRENLTPGQYNVKIERISPDTENSKIIDQVHIGSIRSIKSKPPIRAESQKDLTIIAMRVLATSKVNGVLERFNYVGTSKLPVHTGNGSGRLHWLNSAETRNPAAMLMYALKGRPAQQAIDDDDIDWASLETFYAWCEKHNYFCDAYISESFTIAELLKMIGSTARADILRIDSKLSIVQDIERPSPMQLFTPKNTINYNVTMFSADIPDAIELRFIDENAGYLRNELAVYNTPDGNRITEPESVQKIDLWGITNSAQVRLIGMYNYGCFNNRPFVHTIEADIEYLIVNKGDWIQYAGDIALVGSAQGRIKDFIWVDGVCIGIKTDEPMSMEQGQQYAVRIRKSDGVVILKDVVFSPGRLIEKTIHYYPRAGENDSLFDPFIGDIFAVDESSSEFSSQNELYFIEPFDDQNMPEIGDIYAFGIRGYEVLDLIITDINPGKDFTAVLTCVEYSPEIFGVDEPGFILPNFENKITPVSGAIDSGVVSSARNRYFTTYHDSDSEPPKPTGDGQEGNWHHVQTFRSVWQSSKMAESVEDGEWGAPVRIRAERGNEDITPVWLSLSPQRILLECDSEGNILAGLLPFTSQARLMQWNSSISQGVVFSLINAPAEIEIDENGSITVGENTDLGDDNSITVQANYQGAVYTAVLVITRDKNSSAPRYLGMIETMPNIALVTILKGPVQGQVRARQGDYVLAVAALSGQRAGSVFQWSGLAWEYRSPERYADLYTRCFKDGLDVPGLAFDTEWFGAVFARLIVAQQAFIEELETKILKITGVIYGGNRFDRNGNVMDENESGWWLGPDGILKAFQGIFNNIKLTADTFEITANNKGYLPIGFIYFQLRGQPRPQDLFTGVWEDISSQYAGLFFRVEGGNAAAFGQDQGMMIESHRHVYAEAAITGLGGGDGFGAGMHNLFSVNTSYTGGIETRPVNTTIRVWIRRS